MMQATLKGKRFSVEKLITFRDVCHIHLRRYGWGYLALGVFLAAFQHYCILGFNTTPSIPLKYFIVIKGMPVHRGDVMAFHWKGDKRSPQGAMFVKYVMGVPGDVVTVKGDAFFVNGTPVGEAKARDHYGEILVPNKPKTLGPEEYYGYGTHPKSMDSRYAKVGYIKKSAILGRAIPIF